MTKVPTNVAAATPHSLVMDIVANGRRPLPASPPVEPTTEPESADPVAPITPAAQATPATPTDRFDYAATFLKSIRGPKPKAVYLPQTMHSVLATVIQASPDTVSMSDLLINIITHHFELFGPAMRQFLNAQERAKKAQMPF